MLELKTYIVNKVWSSEFKFAEGVKIIEKRGFDTGSHLASYTAASGETAYQTRGESYEWHLIEQEGQQYVVVALWFGHFDDTEVYAVKFNTDDVKSVSDQQFVKFLYDMRNEESRVLLQKLHSRERRANQDED